MKAMDAVFQALAHAHRRRILDLVCDDPGMTVTEIAGHFEISRIAVMKHLRILEAAELVATERDGKEKRHYFNVVPIQLVYERWTDRYSRFLAPRLTAFKRALEADSEGENGDDRGAFQRRAANQDD
jgi:DNA-binding transcriptional ArsR family regulator